MAVLSQLALAGCSVVGIRTVEEPPYRVLEHVGAIEIRGYSPRLAAETTVAGEERAALREGFNRLAGYIFGRNATGGKIEMTAPVAPARPGPQIAMTAPVGQARTDDGGFVVRFFMPSQYQTVASLPRPLDDRVRLVTAPGETVAVLRFSGLAGPAAMAEQQRGLLSGLAGSAWRAVGAPFAWYYDPPWTIPFLRRNEAVVDVARR